MAAPQRHGLLHRHGHCDAAKLSVVLGELEVTVESESDNRGMLGLDESVSAGMGAIQIRVKIAAPSARPEQLDEIVRWADAHSSVGCTLRQSPACSRQIQVG